jgi:ketosteroid isomerase-like protein
MLVTLTGTLLLLVPMAYAQNTTNDQADVWATVEGQWNAVQKGDSKWIDRMLLDNFSGWGNNSPAPRSKTSTRMWTDFGDKQGRVVAHELYPLAIVVEGDIAVAHYLYTSAFENSDNDVEMNNGRYTDILVRTDDGWKFIAWHGGDDPKDDD